MSMAVSQTVSPSNNQELLSHFFEGARIGGLGGVVGSTIVVASSIFLYTFPQFSNNEQLDFYRSRPDIFACDLVISSASIILFTAGGIAIAFAGGRFIADDKTVPSSDNKKLLCSVFKRVQNKAIRGAALGTAILGWVTLMYASRVAIEAGRRSLGREPTMPYLEGECSLPKFSNFPDCKETTIQQALAIVYVISLPILLAAGVGVAEAISEHASFSKKK